MTEELKFETWAAFEAVTSVLPEDIGKQCKSEERDGDIFLVFDKAHADAIDEAIANAPDPADHVRRQKRERVREEIDVLAGSLVAQYTATEQKGWLKAMAEAQAFAQSGEDADAPGIAIQAAIRGVSVADRVASIQAAASITAMVPDIAAAWRSKAASLIDASDGTEEGCDAVLALLAERGAALLAAAQAGDADALLAAATAEWNAG